MSNREKYAPGPAAGAKIQKEGEKWILVLTRDLRHPPAKVWAAITEPDHLREWAPFDPDRNLGAVGSAKLTTVGAPAQQAVAEIQVKRADAPKALEYTWGGSDLRWELEPLGSDGTRLMLWHNIPRGFISMGAAGWHICFDVLDGFLTGQPIGRIVGPEAMRFEGWQRLNAEYAKEFGVEPPSWPAPSRT
ncbi:MAG: polyketide cyclase [Fibrobacteres bacterium]|nr:polyketide cyclase [Fibrobacterota bacterium]